VGTCDELPIVKPIADCLVYVTELDELWQYPLACLSQCVNNCYELLLTELPQYTVPLMRYRNGCAMDLVYGTIRERVCQRTDVEVQPQANGTATYNFRQINQHTSSEKADPSGTALARTSNNSKLQTRHLVRERALQNNKPATV
jgi:hypothetical protein